MTPRTRLRRVALLCISCLRNIAYNRAGKVRGKLCRSEAFWVTLSNNFLDMAVLEWCKVFGDARGAQYWGKVLTKPTAFEAHLYSELQITSAAFEAYIKEMREYRDKFLAHLDSELTMHIPKLDIAVSSSKVLLEYLYKEEDAGGYFSGMPKDITRAIRGDTAHARQHYHAYGKT